MDAELSKDLDDFAGMADEIPNTPMMVLAKIQALVLLNMRYERIMIDRDLKKHPYALVKRFVHESKQLLSAWREVQFIEKEGSDILYGKSSNCVQKHHALFQKLWTKFTPAEYEERIERYVYRLEINGLTQGMLKDRKCIDFGCGHGNFAHALLRAGATFVYGIDVGESSIKFANLAREAIGISETALQFKVESVYDVSQPDNSFDFAIQNGVFHHIENEDEAYQEAYRVLRPSGWMWIYTDGKGGISHTLWDVSMFILRKVPQDFIISALEGLNLSTGKRYHLGDGLNATYRHTTYEEITERLKNIGFGNFRRLRGGYPTDFDHDVIESDKYGKEKFGSGDIRLLAQKL